ncbi:S1/P1 nuclease [Legionella sp. D16C41]|uniref:S1/P1 nuclease n=1 Tax=Legionella sp. D16C41 TaxID=3402688 RepID=UPI003AF95617
MRKRISLVAALSLGLSLSAHAWNSLGHRLVAQIAYDQLTPQAKQLYDSYNHELDQVYGRRSLVSSAPWLDRLRYRNELWLQALHFIDIPYSIDNTPTVEPDKVNAVYAINEAISILKSKTTSTYDKGFSLRVLLHVIGDIHQPMHAVSLYSKNYPNGDKGGNLVKLAANSVGDNLHAYWDNGGGYLKKRYSPKTIAKQAQLLQKRWPCSANTELLSPEQWAEESHQLAVELAYLIKEGEQPSKAYEHTVKATVKQRLATAGCRLGNLLNQVAKN